MAPACQVYRKVYEAMTGKYRRTRFIGVVLPVAGLLLSLAGAVVMVVTRPSVEKKIPVYTPPLIRATKVILSDYQFTVRSQGTVSPRTESQLVPEVSGRVIQVSESFASGGFFEDGDLLIKIDDFDYKQALISSRADLSRSQLRLAQEKAEARVARQEWKQLGRGRGSALALREPQIAEAEAAVAAAHAVVESAQRNISRTEIRSPYAGRIRHKTVDVGQFVVVGVSIATIYSVDAAEVRLPLPDEELAFLNLPLTYRGGSSPEKHPSVALKTMFAGKTQKWMGQVVRTEGEIDATTRMVHVVARVDDPYGRGEDWNRPPLKAGMFVEAEIEGRSVQGVAILRRLALRLSNRMWVVDHESRLRYRDVEVLRADENMVVVSEGLLDGDLVVLSSLDVVTEGMLVRVDDTPANVQ